MPFENTILNKVLTILINPKQFKLINVNFTIVSENGNILMDLVKVH